MEHEKENLKFDQTQYDRLTEEGVSAWNDWRLKNPDEDILLEGAHFGGRNLKGVFLNSGIFKGKDGPWFKGKVYLKGAKFYSTNLEGAFLIKSYLQDTQFQLANLKSAHISGAHLQGADLSLVNLEGTVSRRAIVDALTLVMKCKVNRNTDFRGVDLGNLRVDVGTRQLLEYNERRMNWEDWYKENKCLKWFVKPFWRMSDYGRSTLRVIFSFFVLAFVFAMVYWLRPSCVVVNGPGDLRGFFHAFYFSVVTMTTLGFGDIAANPDSMMGQALLMSQVLLGYALLGALVTRFNILFTAGGPAGKMGKVDKGKITEE